MKRDRLLVAGMACILAAGLALAGCGAATGSGGGASGGSVEAADAKARYVGYWQIESMASDGEEIAAEDLETLRSLGGAGSDFIVYLAEDGTGAYDAFGEVEDLSWDADAGTVTTPSDGETMDMAFEDGKLALSQGSDKIVFSKGDDSLADQIEADRKAAEEEASGAAIEDGTDGKAQGVAIDPITVADDDVCSISISQKAVDDWGDAGYVFDIVNKSGKSITVWVPSGKTAVAGTMDELYLSARLLPGTSATEFGYFDDVDSVDGLTDVRTTIEVYDSDTLDDLASYDVAIP